MGIAGPDYKELNSASTVVSDETQNCNQAIEISQPKRKEVEEAIKKVKVASKDGKWSRDSQILITVLLTAIFLILCFSIHPS